MSIVMFVASGFQPWFSAALPSRSSHTICFATVAFSSTLHPSGRDLGGGVGDDDDVAQPDTRDEFQQFESGLSPSVAFDNRAMKVLIKIGLFAILGLVILGVVLPLIHADKITPNQATRSRIAVLRLRILEYARMHDQLPADLLALSLKPDERRYLSDNWRREMVYEVEASGTVTLKSFGRDGIPGGSGRNEDIVVSFPSRRPDGTWSEASDSN